MLFRGSNKIGPTLQPVFVSKKLQQDFEPKEPKSSIINQRCVKLFIIVYVIYAM